jgi:hypothetical protein
VNTNGDLTCNVPRGQDHPKTVGQDCTIESAGSDIQTDNCGPGLLCMDDSCYARCFQFCKDNGDCPTSSCSRDAGGGQKVCDVPFMDTCSAILANAATGCGPGAMACYLSSNDPMHTICDCPLNAKGPNQDCARSRECFPGLACVDRENGQTPKCLQVCRLTMGAIDCPQPATAASCHPYKGIPAAGSTQQHATFGYCY